jgi:hypothetical protein
MEDRDIIILRFEHGEFVIGHEDDLCAHLDPLVAGGYLRGAITPFLVTPPAGGVPMDQMMHFAAPPGLQEFGRPASASFADVARVPEPFPRLDSSSKFLYFRYRNDYRSVTFLL